MPRKIDTYGREVLQKILNFGTHRGVNVVDPVDDQDVASKKYVDDIVRNSGRRYHAAGLLVSQNLWHMLNLDGESFDVGSNWSRTNLTGTTTSDGTGDNSLNDSGATFITDGVAADGTWWARNQTDKVSYEITSVDSETKLTLAAAGLANAKDYHVYTCKWVVSKAVPHEVDIRVWWDTPADQDYMDLKIEKNGTMVSEVRYWANSASPQCVSMNDTINCSVDDELTFFCKHGASGNMTYTGGEEYTRVTVKEL